MTCLRNLVDPDQMLHTICHSSNFTPHFLHIFSREKFKTNFKILSAEIFMLRVTVSKSLESKKVFHSYATCEDVFVCVRV